MTKQKTTENEKTLAQRFIECFNKVDYSLRTRYNLNRSMSFSDLIRRTVGLNYIVRKYEDELIDYGRLRNAIVHQARADIIIAEPHEDIVKRFEKIENLINKPVTVLDTVCRRDILSVDADKSMEEVIKLIATSHYSNIPVYRGNKLIGIANGQKILDAMGIYLAQGGKAKVFLENVKIEDMLSKIQDSNYYNIAPANLTVEDALKMFHENPKLLAVLVTKKGSETEIPLGIITTGDILRMNSILEQ